MLNGYAYSVEEYQHDDEPIKPLRLYCVPDPETKSLFRTPEVRTFTNGAGFAFQKTCSIS